MLKTKPFNPGEYLTARRLAAIERLIRYEFKLNLIPQEKTDKKLADQYRSLCNEARIVRETLIKKGYMLQGYLDDGRGWVEPTPVLKWRFTKQEQIVL